VVRCSARALLGPATVLVALAVLPACGLISVVGVSGRVVDRETGQPIEGAVVSLWRTAHCASFHAYSRYLPPAEARTDATGRFAVGRGRTATTAGFLSVGWSRNLRILSPGYVAESFNHDDPWLKADTSDFGLLKTQPVALERVRYTQEAREELENFKRMEADDPRPGPAWQEVIAQLASARVRTLDGVGVFVRRPGAIFDQIVVVELLTDHQSRRRAVVLARDRRTGTVQGFTERGDPVSVPLPAPGFSLVGASSRLGVPLLEKDFSLYYPAELDFAAPLNGLNEQGWTRMATRGGLRAIVALREWWIVLEADGSAIVPYRVVEQSDRNVKSRLKTVLSGGPRLSVADVVAVRRRAHHRRSDGAGTRRFSALLGRHAQEPMAGRTDEGVRGSAQQRDHRVRGRRNGDVRLSARSGNHSPAVLGARRRRARPGALRGDQPGRSRAILRRRARLHRTRDRHPVPP
jgi:hypothetical protein